MNFGFLGSSFGGMGRGGAGVGAFVQLSASSVAENASIGDDIGTLSVVGATGTPTFTLADDASGLFALNVDGVTLEVDGALDYETATFHNIVVSVSGVTPSIANTSFTIIVTDVLESSTNYTATYLSQGIY